MSPTDKIKSRVDKYTQIVLLLLIRTLRRIKQ